MGLPVLYLVNLATLSSNGVVSTEVGEALGFSRLDFKRHCSRIT